MEFKRKILLEKRGNSSEGANQVPGGNRAKVVPFGAQPTHRVGRPKGGTAGLALFACVLS